MSNFKKVGLKWIFIDNFWRLFPVATEKKVSPQDWVATQPSQGGRVSADRGFW